MGKNEQYNRLHSISSLICNTPLLEIRFEFQGHSCVVYAKAEHLNLTGSIKDRMAFHILSRAYERGQLRPGMRIREATSGNTGISFAALGRMMGHPVTIYMPEYMSTERINLIRGYGADIRLISKQEGGFLEAIRFAEEDARSEGNSFLPHQFSNQDNAEAHYLTTGLEIWWQLRLRSMIPQAFIAGVGTGGTIMGVGGLLKEKSSSVKIHPVEPASSPTLSTGCKVGSHRIQGISDEFIPPILHLREVDQVISVEDGDAILMAQKLASGLGLGVGISSGANFIACLKAIEMFGYDGPLVTVFPDDNKKYLSTDLLKTEKQRSDYLAPAVAFSGVRAMRRVCYTCWEDEEEAVFA